MIHSKFGSTILVLAFTLILAGCANSSNAPTSKVTETVTVTAAPQSPAEDKNLKTACTYLNAFSDAVNASGGVDFELDVYVMGGYLQGAIDSLSASPNYEISSYAPRLEEAIMEPFPQIPSFENLLNNVGVAWSWVKVSITPIYAELCG